MASTFRKAEPQQARLKVSVYGPPGSGKTFSTLLMAEGLAATRGKRVAYIDTERGTDFYAQAVPDRKIHPEAFDFDALYTRSLAEILGAVKGLDVATHGVIVIDSISHIWQSAIEAYDGKRTSQDSIPMQAWGKIKRPYKELLNFLISSPFDVFILGRQKNVFEEDTDGKLRALGVAMRAEGETQYEPHICVRMEARQDSADTSRSTYLMYVEKDRTGVLAGRTIPNPSFRTIEPLLPLLGAIQAPAEDEDARIAADGELLDAQDRKNADKESKSGAIFAEMSGKLSSTQDMTQLGAIVTEAKKLKRSLTEEHTAALRTLFDSKAKEIQTRTVGAL